VLGVRGAGGFATLGEVVGEALEVEVQSLDRTLLDVEDVVDREPVDPVFRRLRNPNWERRVTTRTRISCVASSASSRFQSIRKARP
jgi:hypothetical protein